MSKTLVVDLADLLVELLNANSGQTIPGIGVLPQIDAARTFLPRYKLEELAAFKATVNPRGDDQERITKVQWQHDLTVDLGLQKLLATDSPETTDEMQMAALLLEAETLLNFLKTRPIKRATVNQVIWDPLYDPDDYEQNNCFTSVVRLVYRYTN